MYAAHIVERGPVRSIFNEPRHPYTWGLMGSLPRLDINVERLYQIPGQPPSLLHPPSGCRFHPRCAFAMPICRQQDPQLITVPGDTMHEQACHLDEATKAREAAKLVATLTAGAAS
jgi:oligopeptide/dipeptide ABC transporter ATP-binding protein